MKTIEDVKAKFINQRGFQLAEIENGSAMVYVTDYTYSDFQDFCRKNKIQYLAMFKGRYHMTMCFCFALDN